MKVETAKMISGILLVAFHAIAAGLLVYYPISDRTITMRQFLGWASLEWIIYTIGVAFAKAGED